MKRHRLSRRRMRFESLEDRQLFSADAFGDGFIAGSTGNKIHIYDSDVAYQFDIDSPAESVPVAAIGGESPTLWAGHAHGGFAFLRKYSNRNDFEDIVSPFSDVEAVWGITGPVEDRLYLGYRSTGDSLEEEDLPDNWTDEWPSHNRIAWYDMGEGEWGVNEKTGNQNGFPLGGPDGKLNEPSVTPDPQAPQSDVSQAETIRPFDRLLQPRADFIQLQVRRCDQTVGDG